MRTFKNDHRNNSGLHRLYVRWALDLLELINPVIDELYNRGNWNFSEVATAMDEKRRELILNDAAFFEAAALLAANADTSEYYNEEMDRRIEEG